MASNPLLARLCTPYDVPLRATLAQLVERLIRNRRVAGSIRAGGSTRAIGYGRFEAARRWPLTAPRSHPQSATATDLSQRKSPRRRTRRNHCGTSSWTPPWSWSLGHVRSERPFAPLRMRVVQVLRFCREGMTVQAPAMEYRCEKVHYYGPALRCSGACGSVETGCESGVRPIMGKRRHYFVWQGIVPGATRPK